LWEKAVEVAMKSNRKEELYAEIQEKAPIDLSHIKERFLSKK